MPHRSFADSEDSAVPTGPGTCTIVVTLAASPPAATTLHASALPVLARLQARAAAAPAAAGIELLLSVPTDQKLSAPSHGNITTHHCPSHSCPCRSPRQASKSPFILAVVYMDGTAAETAKASDLSTTEASYLRRRVRGQTRALVEGNTRLLLERLARMDLQGAGQGSAAGDAASDAAAAERRATSAAASASGSDDGGRAAKQRKGAAGAGGAGGGGGALDSIFRTAVGALGGGGGGGGAVARGRASPILMESLRAAVLAPKARFRVNLCAPRSARPASCRVVSTSRPDHL